MRDTKLSEAWKENLHVVTANGDMEWSGTPLQCEGSDIQ